MPSNMASFGMNMEAMGINNAERGREYSVSRV